MRSIQLLLFTFFFACNALQAQYKLPRLNYAYADLEPYIDSATMYIHYNNHHAAYTNNLNAALNKYPELLKKDLIEIFQNLEELPSDIQLSVRNNGGGYYNHLLFWELLTPPAKSKITPAVQKALVSGFGSVEKFKEEFEKAATSRFGSGWAWLIKDASGKLKVISTSNQDNPWMSCVQTKGKPILALDVWEHAYYLKYRSKRADYVKSFWKVVNWEKVEELLY